MDRGIPSRPLLADANILIDFSIVDRSMLTLISSHVGQIHVATPVAQEVDQLAEYEYSELGLLLIEPELSHVVAAAQKRGKLSFEDHLCLILARERGWVCLTNDGRLRRECIAEGVPVLWGLESLALLVEGRNLTPKDAEAVAMGIHEVNPRHISEQVLYRFRERIGVIVSGPPKTTE